MPEGICKIERIESQPSIEFDDFIGTPITGMGVNAAIIPGKCAAPPAPAIITRIPLAYAFLEKSIDCCGVLCAERAFISKGISNSSNILAACSIIGKSEVLPIIMLTFAFIVK